MTPITSSPISLAHISHTASTNLPKFEGRCAHLASCCLHHLIPSPDLSFPRSSPYFHMNSKSRCLQLPSLPQTPHSIFLNSVPSSKFPFYVKSSHSNFYSHRLDARFNYPFIHSSLLLTVTFLYNFPLISSAMSSCFQLTSHH